MADTVLADCLWPFPLPDAPIDDASFEVPQDHPLVSVPELVKPYCPFPKHKRYREGSVADHR
jgi:hypothetical protein